MSSRAEPTRTGSEWELVLEAYERLQAAPRVGVSCHVPLLGRCVDLVFIRRRVVTTVEFKLTDWRRAIRQARDHRLGADYAYVCMPTRQVTDPMREELAEAGVGLVFYSEDGDWPFKIVVRAPRSTETWQHARDAVVEYVRSNGRDAR